MKKETIKVSIQGMGDIWLYELSLPGGTVKWRKHPFVDKLSKEFKQDIEQKEKHNAKNNLHKR